MCALVVVAVCLCLSISNLFSSPPLLLIGVVVVYGLRSGLGWLAFSLFQFFFEVHVLQSEICVVFPPLLFWGGFFFGGLPAL